MNFRFVVGFHNYFKNGNKFNVSIQGVRNQN